LEHQDLAFARPWNPGKKPRAPNDTLRASALLGLPSMSPEPLPLPLPLPLDSGAVLVRATPVLTFSTEVRSSYTPGIARRERLITPTPLPVTRAKEQPPQSSALPVIPRIVRRTLVDADGALLRAVARGRRAFGAVRRSALGTMIGAAVLLAALGGSAGVALRSLSDPAQLSPMAVPVADAPSPERLLVVPEAPLATAPPVRAETAPSEPSPAPVGTGSPPAPAAQEAPVPASRAGAAQSSIGARGARARIVRPPHGATPRSGISPRGRGHPSAAHSDARRPRDARRTASGKPKRANLR
jgi:hypothetical protein